MASPIPRARPRGKHRESVTVGGRDGHHITYEGAVYPLLESQVMNTSDSFQVSEVCCFPASTSGFQKRPTVRQGRAKCKEGLGAMMKEHVLLP